VDKHFLPETSPDILIRRDMFPPDEDHDQPWTLVRVNVPRVAIWHSDRFEFGPNHRGPAADLALNILQAYLPGEEIECVDGTKCSKDAALLHQPFKLDFLAAENGDRIRIENGTIKEWIKRELPKRRADLQTAVDGLNVGPMDGEILEKVKAHSAAPALLFLIGETKRAAGRTDLQILDAFLSKFPNLWITNHDTAGTVKDVIDDLFDLSVLSRELATRTTPSNPDAANLLERLRALLDDVERKLGIDKEPKP
jgi:hypothetical protein